MIRPAGAALLRRGLALAAALSALGALSAAVLGLWGAASGSLRWTLGVDGLWLGAAAVLAWSSLLAAGAQAIFAVAGRARPSGVAILAGLVGAALVLAQGLWRAQQQVAALRHAPIHDVSTDWRDPPMPTAALLRRRGADALPIERAPLLQEGPRAGFLGRPVASVSAAACPQARSLVLPRPPSEAYARVKRAAAAAGLRLVTDAPAAGVLEAEAGAPLALGAHTDVLARVRASTGGAVIDLHSVSRHVTADGGVNCLRITGLLAAIER